MTISKVLWNRCKHRYFLSQTRFQKNDLTFCIDLPPISHFMTQKGFNVEVGELLLLRSGLIWGVTVGFRFSHIIVLLSVQLCFSYQL